MRIEDFDTIISLDRLMLVDLYATRCGTCRAMNYTLERVALTMSDIATLISIDTSSKEHMELVHRYNIRRVPTLIIFRRARAYGA